MLNLKPRLDPGQHAAKLLRRHRCTICGKPFVGHHSARQCSDACRAEAIRARGRVSSQRIRDERHEPLPERLCLWCREPMESERSTKRTCSDRCRAALARFERRAQVDGPAAQKGQAAAPAPQAPSPRSIDIRDWPQGDGCTFKLTWPDGLNVEVQIKDGAAVLTADAWEETLSLTPDGKQFVCNACDQPTLILHEGPEEFLCGKCIAGL